MSHMWGVLRVVNRRKRGGGGGGRGCVVYRATQAASRRGSRRSPSADGMEAVVVAGSCEASAVGV